MTTEEIQQQIERTRGEMAGTLEAIERKLNPRQILDQAVGTMRGLASDDSRMGSMIREHPVPLALIGLGIGWLAVAGSLRGRNPESEAYESVEGGPGLAESGWGGARGESDYSTAAGVGSSGYGAEGTQGFTAGGEAASRMGEAAGQARRSIRRATDYTRQRVSEWRRSAGSAASDAAGRGRDVYQDNPLAIGIAAAVLGAALGAVLPRTRMEGRLMGGAVNDIVRQARQTGGDLMERAGRVAKSAMRAARPSGEEHPTAPSTTMH